MWTRRDLLKAGAASSVLAALPGAGLAASRPASGPRYVVIVFLRGGMDTVYTMDPKTRAQVAPGVDVPYEPTDIIDAGAYPLGPHFKQLSKWAPKMSLVRGIQVRTANHESGALQVLRLKTAVSRRMPGILDIIGQRRHGQPLASVSIGRLSSLEHSPSGFATPTFESKNTILDTIDGLGRDDFDAVAKAYRAHLARVEKWAPSGERVHTLDHLDQVTKLFTKLPEVSRFEPEKWSERGGRQALARDLQRTLWLIENDLTRGVYLKIFLDWDSHFRNASKQTGATKDFTFVFNKFLEQLHTRSNAHGNLADNTLLVAGSELGRFPMLNGNLGKDHFPEAGYLAMGAGIKQGHAFGPTGRMMEGGQVSLTTGMPEAGGTHLVLDDLGTTLLHLTGYDPTVYGYRGRRMRFLEAT